jgi:hypothetical protein
MLQFLTGLVFGGRWRRRPHANPLAAPAQAHGAAAEPQEMAPEVVHEVLRQAALRYARMSPSAFDAGGELRVTATRLRQLALVDSATWSRLPAHAHDTVWVSRNAAGALSARVVPSRQGTEAVSHRLTAQGERA